MAENKAFRSKTVGKIWRCDTLFLVNRSHGAARTKPRSTGTAEFDAQSDLTLLEDVPVHGSLTASENTVNNLSVSDERLSHSALRVCSVFSTGNYHSRPFYPNTWCPRLLKASALSMHVPKKGTTTYCSFPAISPGTLSTNPYWCSNIETTRRWLLDVGLMSVSHPNNWMFVPTTNKMPTASIMKK